jgi:hypothetical protein
MFLGPFCSAVNYTPWFPWLHHRTSCFKLAVPLCHICSTVKQVFVSVVKSALLMPTYPNCWARLNGEGIATTSELRTPAILEFLKCGIKNGVIGITCLPYFMKIHRSVRKLLGEHTQTERRTDRLVILHPFLNDSRQSIEISRMLSWVIRVEVRR